MVITAALLGGLALVARRLEGNWLAPGAFFALYWVVEAVLPIVLLPRDDVSVGVVLWIAVSVTAVLGGSLLGTHLLPFRLRSRRLGGGCR